jgi:hypothetical protein
LVGGLFFLSHWLWHVFLNVNAVAFTIMKVLLYCICFLWISMCAAQEYKNPVVQFLQKRGYSFSDSVRKSVPDSLRKWPDTVFYNTTYRPKLLGSPTIPVSFSRLELKDGKYQLSPTISLGYGYAWFFGNFIFTETDEIMVKPTFFFGAIGDIALQNNFDLKKLAGIFAGGFIGFGGFSLFGGYDFLANSPSFGIGSRIDIYTIYPKSLKPFGRVKPVRKHKRSAPPVEIE